MFVNKIVILVVVILALSATDVTSHQLFRPRPGPFGDILRARNLLDLLNIANNESARADAMLEWVQADFRGYINRSSARIQRRGQKLIADMENATETCQNLDEVRSFLTTTNETLEREATRDIVAELKEKTNIQRVYQEMNNNSQLAQNEYNRCRSRCSNQIFVTRIVKTALIRTRRNLIIAIRSSNLGDDARASIWDAYVTLEKYEIELNECIRNQQGQVNTGNPSNVDNNNGGTTPITLNNNGTNVENPNRN